MYISWSGFLKEYSTDSEEWTTTIIDLIINNIFIHRVGYLINIQDNSLLVLIQLLILIFVDRIQVYPGEREEEKREVLVIQGLLIPFHIFLLLLLINNSSLGFSVSF